MKRKAIVSGSFVTGVVLMMAAVPLALVARAASNQVSVLPISVTSAPGPDWKRHVIDDSCAGADGVKLGDLNRDGRLDIVTGWEEGGEVRVYLHPGPRQARQPWPRVTVGKVANPEDAIFADLDERRAPLDSESRSAFALTSLTASFRLRGVGGLTACTYPCRSTLCASSSVS